MRDLTVRPPGYLNLDICCWHYWRACPMPRAKVDEIDRRLVGFSNERTSIVEEIHSRVRRRPDLAIYELKRETKVFPITSLHTTAVR